MLKSIILKKGSKSINVGTTKLEEGIYKAIIDKVDMKENKRDPNKTNVIFKFQLKCGNQMVNHDQAFTCINGVPSQRLTDFLSMFYTDIYSQGGEINLDELEGQYVLIELKNQVINGQSYCNIINAAFLKKEEYQSDEELIFG